MLVLGRHARETIYIRVGGEVVVIHVTEVDRGKVRLGFTAAEAVGIWRAEVAPDSVVELVEDLMEAKR